MTSLAAELEQTRPFDSLEQEAHLGILRTAASLEHATAETLRPYGITPTQYNVLRILRGAGEKGLCRYEVQKRLVAKVPDATRLLDRMEAAALVRRHRDQVDRRFVLTQITTEGLALLARLDRPIAEMHRRLLGHMGEERLRTLSELLTSAREACR